jgi:hypothetical protein
MKREILAAVFFATLGSSLVRAQNPPTAASLVTEVKQSQDWLAQAKSFHVIYDTEQLSIRSDAAMVRTMTQTVTTAPTDRATKFTCETAFDQTRFYTRAPYILERV